jgi:hypothetical protein
MKTGLTFFLLSSAAVLAAATEFHVATNGIDAKENGPNHNFSRLGSPLSSVAQVELVVETLPTPQV